MEEEKVETITDLIPKKKIAIVGCSDHKDMAPWGNPDYEIWGVNNMFLSVTEEKLSNVGAWFEIHLISFYFTIRGSARKGRTSDISINMILPPHYVTCYPLPVRKQVLTCMHR